jgi:tetratricopeptide (TPR) repeat protein
VQLRERTWLAAAARGLQRYWLLYLVPPVAFLAAAAVVQQCQRAFHGARYARWQKDYAAAVQAGIAGRREQALRQILAAASGAPEDAQVQSQLAMAFRKLGREKQALTHLERALELDSSNIDTPDSFLALVGAYINEGNFNAANRVLKEKVLDRWPDSAEARYYQGLSTLEGGTGREAAKRALEQFGECLKLAPDHVQARYRSGICLLRLGRFEEAATNLQSVIERNPALTGAYNELSTALRRIGREREADEMLKQFRGLDEKERRVRHLETQLALGRLQTGDLFEMGTLYLDLHQYNKAERALGRFTFEEPTDPRGYRLLVRAYRALGRTPEALRAEKLADALTRGERVAR